MEESEIFNLISGLGGTGQDKASGEDMIKSIAQGNISAGIPALWKLGTSFFQNRKANSLTGARPVYAPPAYSIPPEVQQYLDRTQNRIVDPNLPGQSLMEDKLGAATSNAASTAMQSGQSSADILNTISKIYGGQMDAENNIGITAAKNYQDLTQKKESDVANALLTSAEYKDKKFASDLDRYKGMFQTNDMEPFLQNSAAASALRDASGRNAYGGINDLSSLGALNAKLLPYINQLKRQRNNRTSGGAPGLPTNNSQGGRGEDQWTF